MRPWKGQAEIDDGAKPGLSSEDAEKMKAEISHFYDHHIKFLMYRDWSGFELFYIEILKCSSLSGLAQIAHRFEAFLVTLLIGVAATRSW